MHTLRFERSWTKCWEFRLSDRFAIGAICETEDEGGGKKGNKYENRARSQYAQAAKKWTKLRLPEEEKGRRWARSRESWVFSCSLRGSVIAGSLKSRASDDRVRTWRRERGRKNVRCTCLYLFCIISAALPRVPRRPAGFTAGLISFPFLGTCRGAIPYYLAKSLPALRELIRPRC